MQFIHQPLTWGFFLVLLPLLIHLINMVRRRRVKWAAMEFLLQSYKKHKKWIWLKQFLLLLMRMAAVALIVMMLAQWVSKGHWLNLFGGKATHHYVLLDDSYSMSDRHGGVSAFEQGLTAIQRVGANAAAQDSRQKFTLIRFSRAAKATAAADKAQEEAAAAQVADFNATVVGADFDLTLEERRNTLAVTQSAVGPRPALSLLEQLIERGGDENRLVYVVSDFRAKEWSAPQEIKAALREIENAPAEIHLVNCAKDLQPNLGITALAPLQETRAAGVPLFISITVKNYSDSPARNVQLKVRSIYFDPDAPVGDKLDEVRGKVDELPTVLIEEIAAGQTETRRVQVFFPKPGQHVVEADLADDAVAADNFKWTVIDFPAGERVLVVDGSQDQRHAYFMQSVFQPGERARTGIDPQVPVDGIAFLRDVTPEVLGGFRAVYLLDVPRLDERAVKNLEAYVKGGGGVAVFVGPNVNRGFYNQQLYRDGNGLFPVPLEAEANLPPPLDEEPSPDLEIEDHPVFEVFLGERNSLIRLVTFEKYLRAPDNWQPPEKSTVTIAARLRNQSPLAVEQKFGDGRVMVFLSTLAPQWNNWGHDPTFVVMLLKLQSFLASSQRATPARLVGEPIAVELESAKFRQDMQFVTPGETPETRLLIERTAAKATPESPVMTAGIGSDSSSGEVGETDVSGLYEAWPISLEGRPEVRRFAVNVDFNEGDLTQVKGQDVLASLAPVKARFRNAEEFDFDLSKLAGNNRSMLVMGLLILLLMAEQFMAYVASYHPARQAAG